MVEINPPDGSKATGSQSSHQGKAGDFNMNEHRTFHAGGKGFSAFKDWLGEKGYKQFQQTLCKSMVQEIAKNKQKQHEVSERLKRSFEGKDLYD